MAEPPRFSIVTISFQNRDGLQKTVESVWRQTYRDFEHIVVDGGSTDGSAEWLRDHFAGSWVSEPDDGRYPAMNKGAAMAKGTYLWFLHAGDVLGDVDVLRRVANAFAGGQAWGYGLARVVGPDHTLEGTLGFAPFSMFNFAILGHPLAHQATVIRRDLFVELGGYALDLPVAADQLLLLQAASREQPVALADFLCDFDSTGISAGRPWWISFRDGERNRRRGLDRPVTRSRVLDTGLALTYAAVRQLARSGRQVLMELRGA